MRVTKSEKTMAESKEGKMTEARHVEKRRHGRRKKYSRLSDEIFQWYG
jgi:hypothetical protein